MGLQNATVNDLRSVPAHMVQMFAERSAKTFARKWHRFTSVSVTAGRYTTSAGQAVSKAVPLPAGSPRPVGLPGEARRPCAPRDRFRDSSDGRSAGRRRWQKATRRPWIMSITVARGRHFTTLYLRYRRRLVTCAAEPQLSIRPFTKIQTNPLF